MAKVLLLNVIIALFFLTIGIHLLFLEEQITPNIRSVEDIEHIVLAANSDIVSLAVNDVYKILEVVSEKSIRVWYMGLFLLCSQIYTIIITLFVLRAWRNKNNGQNISSETYDKKSF